MPVEQVPNVCPKCGSKAWNLIDREKQNRTILNPRPFKPRKVYETWKCGEDNCGYWQEIRVK